MRMIFPRWIPVLAAIALAGCGSTPPDPCSVEAVSALGIPNMTFQATTTVEATASVPQHCKLSGTLVTDGDGAGPNQPRFELFLPSAWNRKLLMNGGGGFDGYFTAPTADQLAKGYAIVQTDSGHTSTYAVPPMDATFAFTAPGVANEPAMADYLYRARHQVAVSSKVLVSKFFKQDITRSYFMGCSNGGHEALVQAARYPEDFDGIVAGAAWSDQAGDALWSVRNFKSLLKAPIPYAKLDAINAAVLAQCDGLDGLVDGMIQNPAACSFDPRTLQANGNLSADEAGALETYLSAVRDQSGNLVIPGSSVSGLHVLGNTLHGLSVHSPEPRATLPQGPQPWGELQKGPIKWMLSYGVIAQFGYGGVGDAGLNLVGSQVIDDNGRVVNAVRDQVYARLARGAVIDPAQLSSFIAGGRKLLMYEGLSDAVVNPHPKLEFYKTLASLRGGYPQAQQNVRMFAAPEMQHCSGGTGPNTFDALTAIENWVEQNAAPDAILATKYTDDDPAKPALRTMPLCPFPAKARYAGAGNVSDAANWSCPAGDTSMLRLGANGTNAGLR